MDKREEKEMNLFGLDFETLKWIGSAILGCGLFTYLIWIIQSRKQSLLIRIKAYPEKTKICKPNEEDNTVVIQKEKKGKKPEWKANYTRNCKVPLRGLFKPPYALDIFPDATNAIEYDWELKKTDQPKWDKEQSYKFVTAKALENRGEGLNEKTPMGIWIVCILVVVSLVLQFASMRGIRLV
jgi:hypothetical protein